MILISSTGRADLGEQNRNSVVLIEAHRHAGGATPAQPEENGVMMRLAYAYRVGHILAGRGWVLDLEGKELALAEVAKADGARRVSAFGYHSVFCRHAWRVAGYWDYYLSGRDIAV